MKTKASRPAIPLQAARRPVAGSRLLVVEASGRRYVMRGSLLCRFGLRLAAVMDDPAWAYDLVRDVLVEDAPYPEAALMLEERAVALLTARAGPLPPAPKAGLASTVRQRAEPPKPSAKRRRSRRGKGAISPPPSQDLQQQHALMVSDPERLAEALADMGAYQDNRRPIFRPINRATQDDSRDVRRGALLR